MATKLAVVVVVAYYGLAVIGALGNRAWLLVVMLVLPLVYIAASELVRRRTRPATVPADRHGGR